jgi:hypothetical protein
MFEAGGFLATIDGPSLLKADGKPYSLQPIGPEWLIGQCLPAGLSRFGLGMLDADTATLSNPTTWPCVAKWDVLARGPL